MTVDRLATEYEIAAREIGEFLRKVLTKRDTEDRHVACSRNLRHVWKARSIAECGVAHAKATGFGCHHLRKTFFRPTEEFTRCCCNVIGRFCHHGKDSVFNTNALTRLETDLCRRTCGGIGRDWNAGIFIDATGFHCFEKHIHGHHFGQRRRITSGVCIGCKQRFTCVRIDYDRGIPIASCNGWHCCGGCGATCYDSEKKSGLRCSFQGVCDFTECGTHDDDLPVSRFF
ncbi:hypothetical protein FQZ97_901570 [compost metagenome]